MTLICRVFSSINLFFKCVIVRVQTVGVSAATGDGLPEFFTAVDAATVEYERLLA